MSRKAVPYGFFIYAVLQLLIYSSVKIAKMNAIRTSTRIAAASHISTKHALACRQFSSSVRNGEDRSSDSPSKDDKDLVVEAQKAAEKPKAKTVAEADAELMEKLAGHSDEGGAAGVEYENGKPVAQKRSVKNNMFRLI